MGIRLESADAAASTGRWRRRSAQVAVLVAFLIVLVWVLLRPDGAVESAPSAPVPPAEQAVLAGSTLAPKPCHRPVDGPFVPKQITVPGVTRDAEVLALPRDSAGVPQAPPISEAGKSQFAWDIPSSPRPGSAKGNVLLNAHTYPDGSAMGNKLLEGLQVGDKIIVHGVRKGKPQTLCYRVTKEQVIIASDGSWEYYAADGPPQIALIVCSPPRLGPGNWLKRTIWYASPMAG